MEISVPQPPSSSGSNVHVPLALQLSEKIRSVSSLLVGKSINHFLFGSNAGSRSGNKGPPTSPVLLRALSLHNQALDFLTQHGDYDQAIEAFREADNTATTAYDTAKTFEIKVFAIRIRLVCALHIQDFFLVKHNGLTLNTGAPQLSPYSPSSSSKGLSPDMIQEAVCDQITTLFSKLVACPDVENALKQEFPDRFGNKSVFRRLSLTSTSAKRKRFLILAELSSIRVAMYEVLYGGLPLSTTAVPSGASTDEGGAMEVPSSSGSTTSHPKRNICQLNDLQNQLLDFSMIDPQRLTSHHETVTSLIIINHRLFSGSFDKQINVYDTITLNQIAVISFEQGGVCCFAHSNASTIEEDYLFVGLNNGKILVIDVKSLLVLQTLSGHEWAIQCMAIHDGILYSGSYDKSIRMWGMPQATSQSGIVIPSSDDRGSTGSSSSTGSSTALGYIGPLPDCVASVCSLVISSHSQHIIASFSDTTIVIWHLYSKKWLKTLTGHTSTVTQLVVYEPNHEDNMCDTQSGSSRSGSNTAAMSVDSVTAGMNSKLTLSTSSGDLTTSRSNRTQSLQSNQTASQKSKGPQRRMSGSGSTPPVPTVYGKLFSAALDQTIRVWSLSPATGFQCLHTISLDPTVGSVSCAMSILNHGRELWFGTEQGYIQAIDTVSYHSLYHHHCHHIVLATPVGQSRKNKDSEKEKETSLTKIQAIAVSGGKLVTTSKDHTIQIRDIVSNKLITTMTCTRAAEALLIDDGRIYGGGLTVRSILL